MSSIGDFGTGLTDVFHKYNELFEQYAHALKNHHENIKDLVAWGKRVNERLAELEKNQKMQ